MSGVLQLEDDGSRCPVSYMIGMNICPDIHVNERAMCRYLSLEPSLFYI